MRLSFLDVSTISTSGDPLPQRAIRASNSFDTASTANWAVSRRPFRGTGGVGTREDEREGRASMVER